MAWRPLKNKKRLESVEAINQSEKAKKKLAAIAKNNGLDDTLVSYLFSFHWNYDSREGGTWVYDRDLLHDAAYASRYEYLLHTLGLSENPLSRNEVINVLHHKLHHTDETALGQGFLSGVASMGLMAACRNLLPTGICGTQQATNWRPYPGRRMFVHPGNFSITCFLNYSGAEPSSGIIWSISTPIWWSNCRISIHRYRSPTG